MAQINKRISEFMTYRKDSITINGYTLSFLPAIPKSGSIYSSGSMGNGSGLLATANISHTVAKAVAIYLGDNNLSIDSSFPLGCVIEDPVLRKSYCEIKTQYHGTTQTDVIIYSYQSGSAKGGTIDDNNNVNQIEIDTGLRQGTSLLLAMLPSILKDKEAHSELRSLNNLGYPNADLSTLSADQINLIKEHLARLSDNIYERLKSGNIKCSIESRGKASVSPILYTDLETYAPDLSAGGSLKGNKDFEYLVSTKIKHNMFNYPTEDFLNDFVLNKKRKLTKTENALIPKLPDWYKVPKEAVITCQSIVKSSKKNRPCRNILYKGPAGTGKTAMSKAIAAALHLPYTHLTCDAGMELFNLVGTILPATNSVSDNSSDKSNQKLDLPTIAEIYFDLESAYKKITGNDTIPVGLQTDEVIQLLFDKQAESMKSVCSTGKEGEDFVYVPSELIKAIKNGWVIEIQEPTVIIQPGVLPGLNSLLEGGSITLPTGEIVERHPDSVIIFTTNLDYEGCRSLNESVIDRFPIKFTIDMPNDDDLIERASNITGVSDKNLIKKCFEIVTEIRDYLFSQGCGIGNVGPRSYYDWLDAIDMGYEPLEASEWTILSSASDDEEIKDYIKTNILMAKL